MEAEPKHRLRNELILAGVCLLMLKGCVEFAEYQAERIQQDFEDIDWSNFGESQQ